MLDIVVVGTEVVGIEVVGIEVAGIEVGYGTGVGEEADIAVAERGIAARCCRTQDSVAEAFDDIRSFRAPVAKLLFSD